MFKIGNFVWLKNTVHPSTVEIFIYVRKTLDGIGPFEILDVSTYQNEIEVDNGPDRLILALTSSHCEKGWYWYFSKNFYCYDPIVQKILRNKI